MCGWARGCVCVRERERSRAHARPPTLQSLRAPLRRLARLYALSLCEQCLGDLMESTHLSPRQAPAVRAAHMAAVREVRPDAVPLVDAWAWSDRMLNSALGRFDGRVYEALFDWASEAPLNRTDVSSGYRKYLRRVLKGQMSPVARL